MLVAKSSPLNTYKPTSGTFEVAPSTVYEKQAYAAKQAAMNMVQPETAMQANDPAKIEAATATTTEVTTGEAPAPSTVVQTVAAAQESGPPWGLIAVGAFAAYLLLRR